MLSVQLRTLLPWLLAVTAGCSAHDPEDARTDLKATDVAPGGNELQAGAVATVGPFSLPARTHDERLDARFATPPGFARAEVEPKSFGAFLRGLPVRSVDVPLVDFHGWRVYRNGQPERVAGVVVLDIGSNEPPCAAILRLNAEWHYAWGDSDVAYRANDGTVLTYPAFLAGERAWRTHGVLRRVQDDPIADAHDAFRWYLQEISELASPASLEHDAPPVALDSVLAGDFFLSVPAPTARAVLVLDLARDPRGRLALLLGQAQTATQGLQVLHGEGNSAWFVVEPSAPQVVTPFGMSFPVGALRRLP